MDLRWQDPRLPWNFHGLADGITFRKEEDCEWRPSEEDWDSFLRISRDEKWRAQQSGEGLVAGVPRVGRKGAKTLHKIQILTRNFHVVVELAPHCIVC
mgnify:CR=1 FL=1